MSTEMEKALVGALLLDPTNMDAVLPILGRDARKFRGEAGTVYQAMVEMYHQNIPLDMLAIADYLRRKGWKGNLEDFLSGDVVAPHAPHYAQRVADAFTLRSLVELATKVINQAYSDGNDVSALLSMLEKGIEDIREETPGGVSDVRSYAEKMADWLLQPYQPKHYSTGIVNLDSIMGGQFEPGRLVTIAGRPGTGKTHVLVALTMSLAKQGVPTLFFSLEMSPLQLLTRMVSYETGIDSMSIQRRQLSTEQQEEIQRVLGDFIEGKYPLMLQTGVRDVYAMQSQIRQTNAQVRRSYSRPLGAVVVDYVQLVPPKEMLKRRDLEISDVTRTLKLTALEQDMVVIAASQLNREIERRAEKKPMLSDLRESGSIEQDSDVVIFTYPVLEYVGEKEALALLKHFEPGWEPYELIVAKNRDGKTGKAKCAWQRSTGHFRSLEEET